MKKIAVILIIISIFGFNLSIVLAQAGGATIVLPANVQPTIVTDPTTPSNTIIQSSQPALTNPAVTNSNTGRDANGNAVLVIPASAPSTGGTMTITPNSNGGQNVTILQPNGSTVSGTIPANTPSSASGGYQPLSPITGPDGTVLNGSTNFSGYLQAIYRIGIGLCFVLGVIMFTWAGIEYIVSESMNTKGDAKNRMTNALIGLAIALVSYILLNTINPDILTMQGFEVTSPGNITDDYVAPNQSSPTPASSQIHPADPGSTQSWATYNTTLPTD